MTSSTKVAPVAAMAALLLVAGVMLTHTVLLPRLSGEAASTAIKSPRRALLHLKDLPAHATTTRQMLEATPILTASLPITVSPRSLKMAVTFKVENYDGVPSTVSLKWRSVPASNKSPTECDTTYDATNGLDFYPDLNNPISPPNCKMNYYGTFRVILTLKNAGGSTIDEQSLRFQVAGEPNYSGVPPGFDAVMGPFDNPYLKYYVTSESLSYDECWEKCRTLPVPTVGGLTWKLTPELNALMIAAIKDSPVMASSFWTAGKLLADGEWHWGPQLDAPLFTWFDWMASTRTAGGGVGVLRSGSQCLALETEAEGQTGTWRKGQCSAARRCLCYGERPPAIPVFI